MLDLLYLNRIRSMPVSDFLVRAFFLFCRGLTESVDESILSEKGTDMCEFCPDQVCETCGSLLCPECGGCHHGEEVQCNGS